MRKIIVLEHISLDGVIQAPGGPEEDTSDGFAYGGWAGPYDDDILGAALQKQMNMPFDLLLGRKTFDIWAAYWPQHADFWAGVNTATKIRRLEHHDFFRMATLGVFRRGCCEKSRRTQARGRTRSAHLGKR
jgi:dihydrofolate reductase